MANRETITRLLKRKNALIEQQQEELEALIVKLGSRFADALTRAVDSAQFDVEAVKATLDALGYSDAVAGRLDAFTDLLRLSRELSEALGVTFVLTAAQEVELDVFLGAVADKFGVFRDEIAADMTEIALSNKLGRRPTAQIKNDLAERMEAQGRRLGTEINTSLRTYDRAVMQDVYDNAGVDRFVYFPDNTIDTSRESCRRVVGDPRQQSGWTRAEIDAMPDVDFVRGGAPYYNCRHQFIPFEGAA